MRVSDLLDDREPEARAGHPTCRLRAVEAVEDERRVLGGDPGAAVAHLDQAVVDGDIDGFAGGLHLRALSSRFVTARSTRSGTP